VFVAWVEVRRVRRGLYNYTLPVVCSEKEQYVYVRVSGNGQICPGG